MNKIVSIALALFLLTGDLNAQYYYKDIISNKQSMQELNILKERKIRNILIHSFENGGEESKGFYCEKKINKDYSRIITYTKAFVADKSTLTALYNKKGQIIRSTDSSELAVSSSIYTYDEKDNITRILSSSYSNDDDFSTAHSEEHVYLYNNKSVPEKMLRIRNNTDTTIINFVLDEQDNITDEIDKSPNGIHYYYYYDAKKRLTDIVKFNVPFNKLLPDILFEYNSDNQVTQMITREEGATTDYFTWKYVYDDGLRIIEKCFSKEKTLMGYFEYEYK